jgi:putative transposase
MKAKAALEALKERKPTNEIAGNLGVHPGQITQWKKIAVDGIPSLFSRSNKRAEEAQEALMARLYQQIGQLKVELDWVKKKSGCSN